MTRKLLLLLLIVYYLLISVISEILIGQAALAYAVCFVSKPCIYIYMYTFAALVSYKGIFVRIRVTLFV